MWLPQGLTRVLILGSDTIWAVIDSLAVMG
jgi:hypothetical protein